MSTTTPNPRDIDVSITGLSPKGLFWITGSIVGAISVATAGIVITLVGVVYSGMKDRIDEMKGDYTRDVARLEKSIQDLSNTFLVAQRSAVEVRDLLQRAPQLETRINETHDEVIKHTALLQALQQSAEQQTQLLQAVQGNVVQLQNQVGDIQRRLPPGPR